MAFCREPLAGVVSAMLVFPAIVAVSAMIVRVGFVSSAVQLWGVKLLMR
jgi:hypothetical protein